MGTRARFFRNRGSWVVIALLMLLLSHQGCGKVNFTSLLASNTKTETDSGNGSGYGGKPSDDYYHFVPGFTCEGKPTVQGHLRVEENTATWTSNSINQCGQNVQQIPLAEIDYSKFQEDVVGYKDLILEKKETIPTQTPSTLVEAWCRESQSSEKFEILAYYNSLDQQAHLRVLYTDAINTNAIHEIQSISVARTIAMKDVLYASQESKLKVDKNKPAATTGFFQGEFEVKIGNQNHTQNVECRLGGLLDDRLWPAKMVADSHIRQYELLKSTGQLIYLNFTYVSNPGQWHGHLLSMDLTSGNNQKISHANALFGVQDFKVSPDESKILFRSVVNIAQELFVVETNGAGLGQIGQPLTEMLQYVEPDYRFSADGNRVFYRDGSQETGGDVEKWLRTTIIGGGPIEQINQILPLAGDIGVYNFAVASPFSKVFYLAGGIYPNLWVYDMVGKGIASATPSLPANWHLEWSGALEQPKGSRWAFVNPKNHSSWWVSPNPQIGNIFAVAADTLEVRNLQVNTNSFSKSPLENWIIADPFQLITATGNSISPNTTFIRASDLQKFTFDLGQERNWRFVKKETQILKNTGSGQREIIDIASGVKSQVCSSATGNLMFSQESEDGNSLYLVFDNGGSRSIWRQDLINMNCIKLNSYIGKEAAIGGLKISSNNKYILLKEFTANVNPLVSDVGQLYIIPTNGKAAVKVNTPASAIGDVTTFQFTNTGSVLYAAQNGADSQRLYLWNIPNSLY